MEMFVYDYQLKISLYQIISGGESTELGHSKLSALEVKTESACYPQLPFRNYISSMFAW